MRRQSLFALTLSFLVGCLVAAEYLGAREKHERNERAKEFHEAVTQFMELFQCAR